MRKFKRALGACGVLVLAVLMCAGSFGPGGSGAAVAHAAGSGAYVTLDSFSGIPGSQVNVSGGNFAVGETVDIFLGTSTSTVATTTAGNDSLFGPVAVTIPAGAVQGNMVVSAVGASSTLSATNNYYVEPLSPSIAATSTANTPGSTVYVNGSGFAANESVDLAIGTASSTATTTATADASGTFSNAALTVPFGISGSQTIVATGAGSGASASASFYVGGFYPSVTPSAYYAVPGNIVTFSGSGFGPGETINVYEDGSASSSAAFSADASGTFSNAGSVSIPYGLTATSTTFSFVGASSAARASTTISVGSISASVTPSAYYVMPGQTVTFSGSGFAANETVDVTASGATGTLATFAADASGTFSNLGSFAVPSALAGSTTTVTLRGATSGAEGQATLTVGKYYSSLTPSQYYLERGDSFTVSLSGFAPYEAVTLDAYGNAATTVTTDGGGNAGAAGPFSVPLSASSTMAVTATGGTSGAVATTSIQVGTAVAQQLSSSTLTVSFATDNSAGGTATSSDFTVNVTGANASPATFTASSTPTTVTLLGDTDFSVTATSSDPNYAISSSGTCAGQIVSSMSGTCALLATYIVPTTSTSTSTSTSSGSGSNSSSTTSTSTSSSSGGSSSGGGGGGIVVVAGGGGGGGYLTPPPFANTSSTSGEASSTSSSTATNASSSTSGGQVLGASTVNVPALQAQLLSLEQELVTLEIKVANITFTFSRNLRQRMSGNDVMALQKLLNASALTEVAASGPGSPGHETTYFGPATARAVAVFQELFAPQILAPNGLSSGNGYVGASTRAELNALVNGNVQP